MINEYVCKLMENLPETITNSKTPMKIDLILGGGAFNGSYILGSLYFLKEMERKKFIIINRISTCSVSSILALLYLTDNLDKANELYFDIVNNFKNNYNFSKLLKLKDLIEQKISLQDCSFLNKKLYICFNDIKTFKKRVIYKFNNTDHLFNIMIRSCFIPFLIDFNPCYKNKYIDGIIPYFFKPKSNTKRIYLDVYTLDKLFYAISVKNEKTNYHRLFEGLLDIHQFFIKNINTTMCSDLDNWNIRNYTLYCIYLFIEQITIRFIYFANKIKCILLAKDKYDCFKSNLEQIIKYFILNICF